MFRTIKNEADASGEILLYDVIGADWFGEGVSAKAFADAVIALGDVKTLTVRINSPGGSVFDGQAIYTTLTKHPAKKIVEIDGLAASAASFVAMAGDEIRMAEIGSFMIHLAMGFTIGNRLDHEKEAAVLSHLDQTIAATYAARTGKDAAYFLDLMGKETWMSAEEAKSHGLITAILPAKGAGEPQACVGPECGRRIMNVYKNVPERAKRFFINTGAAFKRGGTQPLKGKAAMSKCACKNRKNKATYAAKMNAAIDAAVTDERNREAIMGELAAAAEMEMDACMALFTDDGDCPTMEQMDAFATVEGMPDAAGQKEAAMADGCEYAEAAPEEMPSEEEIADVLDMIEKREVDSVLKAI